MRRLSRAVLAAVVPAALLLAGCGGVDPKVEEPLVRDFVRTLARALISKDNDKVKSLILPMAGQQGSPLAAKEWDTPEGKEKIQEGNRRQLRQVMLDAGIMSPEALKSGLVDEGNLDRLDTALKIFIEGKEAMVKFEIAGDPRRMPEEVIWRCSKTENGWRLWDYSREIIPR